MLRFAFRDVSRQLAPGPEGIALRYWAEFQIARDGRVIFEDDHFPVVEFAMASQEWAKGGAGEDFEFEERLGFRLERQAWLVAGVEVHRDDLLDAVEEYYVALREELLKTQDFDLDAFVDRAPRVVRRKLQ